MSRITTKRGAADLNAHMRDKKRKKCTFDTERADVVKVVAVDVGVHAE
jgi:hypothetical protein